MSGALKEIKFSGNRVERAFQAGRAVDEGLEGLDNLLDWGATNSSFQVF